LKENGAFNHSVRRSTGFPGECAVFRQVPGGRVPAKAFLPQQSEGLLAPGLGSRRVGRLDDTFATHSGRGFARRSDRGAGGSVIQTAAADFTPIRCITLYRRSQDLARTGSSL
jgi:hypothetical protein